MDSKDFKKLQGEGIATSYEIQIATTTASFTMRAPSTTLQDLNYTYDANGNITNITDASGTNGAGNYAYEYDNLYRLTRASSTDAITNWLQTYSYDNLGNITNKSDGKRGQVPLFSKTCGTISLCQD